MNDRRGIGGARRECNEEDTRNHRLASRLEGRIGSVRTNAFGHRHLAAMIGVEKLLRIDLDATQGPVSFVRQVVDRLPEWVPAFGKPTGFVINYSPVQAVKFDSNGQLIAILDKAVRPGTAVLHLGVRPIPAEALRLVFGK